MEFMMAVKKEGWKGRRKRREGKKEEKEWKEEWMEGRKKGREEGRKEQGVDKVGTNNRNNISISSRHVSKISDPIYV